MLYDKAKEFISNSSQIIAIGYSFNTNDRASYSELLDAAKGKQILIIDPNADSLVDKLEKNYPPKKIKWKAECLSFKEWVTNGCKLI